MRVLVTGGAGFIGSNLVHALVGSGDAAGVIDDLSTGSAGNLHPAAWFRHLDILDPAFADAVAEFGPEAVVHLAAQPSVQESIKDPARTHAVNVEGTRVVARAALAAGARMVLSASSAAVYGESAVLPLPETAAKGPANPYGTSKLEAETALTEELRGRTDFANLRFSNVFGPRQNWRGEGGVVAIFAAQMAAGDEPVIFGDGAQTRDFIYVGDVVSAIVAALDSESPLAGEGRDGPAYNISTGAEVSVEELALKIRPLAGYTGSIAHAEERPGDIERSALDAAKARETFDWTASVPLDVGLTATLRWFRSTR